MSEQKSLIGLSLLALNELVRQYNQPLYRARQILEWLYQKNARSLEEMSNLPKGFREELAGDGFSVGGSSPVKMAESSDGTRKYLFATESGHFVETAMIPDQKRKTLCVSTQVGCKRACVFCATGKQRFTANLTTADILNQYLNCPERDGITNIVFMGMGEPFDNYEAVKEALTLFTADYALAKSPTRLTVSTVGIIPVMCEYLKDFNAHLALSLHSPLPDQRLALMPVEKQYPIRDVIATLRKFSFAGQRRLTIEYAMIQGVNDHDSHATALIDLIRGLECRVNLIPCNEVPGLPQRPSPLSDIERFQNLLKRAGVVTTIRKSKGTDIAAACGLLSTQALQRPEAP